LTLLKNLPHSQRSPRTDDAIVIQFRTPRVDHIILLRYHPTPPMGPTPMATVVPRRPGAVRAEGDFLVHIETGLRIVQAARMAIIPISHMSVHGALIVLTMPWRATSAVHG
jgi:hypothetical protein